MDGWNALILYRIYTLFIFYPEVLLWWSEMKQGEYKSWKAMWCDVDVDVNGCGFDLFGWWDIYRWVDLRYKDKNR